MMTKPPLPPHDTRFGFIEISLTPQKLGKNWGTCLDALKEEIEPIVIGSGYLEGAPFSWVSLAIRYGLNYDAAPSYEPIDKTYGALPLGIQIDVRDIVAAPDETVRAIFARAALVSLIHAGEKYDRPIKVFRDMLDAYDAPE